MEQQERTLQAYESTPVLQENSNLNLDFGYDCGDEPSEEQSEELDQNSSISSIEIADLKKDSSEESEAEAPSVKGYPQQNVQQSTDTSSQNSQDPVTKLRRKSKKKLPAHKAILEEEEEKSDDDQTIFTNCISGLPNTNPQKTGDKYADREAFLKRPPNQTVTLIRSLFQGREPYLYFPYPPFLKL